MEITGRVIVVLPIEGGTSKSGRVWSKQCFVVETIEQYPKKICFQLFGERMAQLPSVGDDVTVFFDIESHEYNGRWYTQIDAWRVTKVAAAIVEQQAYPQPQPQAHPAMAEPAQDVEEALPF